MNRFEIFLIAVVLAVAVIYFIKSKTFDKFIKSLLNGPDAKDAKDLVEQQKENRKDAVLYARNLSDEEKRILKEKKTLEKLNN